MTGRPRVVVVRGHQATSWELRPWERLRERFDVAYLASDANQFDVESLGLEAIPARTRAGRLPGRLAATAARLTGDRYLRLGEALSGADIVHAEELGYWFAADAARAKRERGFRLVQTVWETLPLGNAFRNRGARHNRRDVLAATDLFLAATERARAALLLEGVPADRIEVCPPGIDVERFTVAPRSEAKPERHLILSPGRLVWEKGHHDVIRALAALSHGLAGAVPQPLPRLMIVGAGPEAGRLRAHADELGVGEAVEIRSVAYDEMPSVFANASCMVLASLPSAGCMLHPLDVPHCFWEEQFGMVLAEAMAAQLPILASRSGAIPEVVGDAAPLFEPGDWLGIARLLAGGPLAQAPGTRTAYDPALVARHSLEEAAERLASAYERVLSAPPV
jgi:glycosyltransferase involved in cell wall biosynthesis